MTEHSQTPQPGDPRKAEKLRAIAAVFGADVAARIAPLPPGDAAGAAPDTDRLAWQTNRLIRHLRERVRDPAPDAAPPAGARSARPDAARAAARPRPIPGLIAGEDLAVEHPAVIAHMLRAEPQPVRVSVLRALPGHLARDVMRRLKSA